jgi:hypothetical protein
MRSYWQGRCPWSDAVPIIARSVGRTTARPAIDDAITLGVFP